MTGGRTGDGGRRGGEGGPVGGGRQAQARALARRGRPGTGSRVGQPERERPGRAKRRSLRERTEAETEERRDHTGGAGESYAEAESAEGRSSPTSPPIRPCGGIAGTPRGASRPKGVRTTTPESGVDSYKRGVANPEKSPSAGNRDATYDEQYSDACGVRPKHQQSALDPPASGRCMHPPARASASPRAPRHACGRRRTAPLLDPEKRLEKLGGPASLATLASASTRPLGARAAAPDSFLPAVSLTCAVAALPSSLDPRRARPPEWAMRSPSRASPRRAIAPTARDCTLQGL
uniref:Uncharacterized protein n=1 Tax=Knipowitschia caucasica TaxID=637954 RepID=A0AAV2M3J8_KNICA